MLGDVAYKLKRGTFDTPPRGQSSDSSDDDQPDGPSGSHTHHHVATPTSRHEKCLDAGTPVSGSKGGKKRVWRKRRRQSNSNSKEDKPKESGALERIQNSDHPSRRQSLPPLTNLLTSQLSHRSSGTILDHTPSTPTLLDESPIKGTAEEGGVSRDSTPKPKHPDTPITPNGSFSPEVSELIESLKHPSRYHRRNGSNGSQRIMTHRRQGSNSSCTSGRGISLEATPLRSPNSVSAPSSKRASTELPSSRRESASGTIPYSKMDSFSSPSDSENVKESSKLTPSSSGIHVPFPKPVPVGASGTRMEVRKSLFPREPVASSVKEIYSNESSMDTHGSDPEEGGNEADGESTSDGYENRFDQLSGPEPNETTESYIESSNSVTSPPSSSAHAESDDVTSCSTPDLSERSNLIPKTHSANSKVWNQNPVSLSHHIPDLTSTFGLKSNKSELVTPTSTNDAVIVPPLELPLDSDEEYDVEGSPTGLTGLTIPLHIRRSYDSPRQKDDGKWCSPVKAL